jgi:serine/threonine-protein kinase RsbW
MPPTSPHPQATDPAAGERAQVELRLPAAGAYATIVRTTAAGLAARLDFTIDEIEDLRIAIGEATALVIPEADAGADLSCRFHVATGSMTVELETQAVHAPDVDRDSFAWQVLVTLAEGVEAASSGGLLRVRFTVRSQVPAGKMGAAR